ncbi:hypothetical protein KC19_6G157700, partial [Ceratodon purpureus]
TPSSATPIPLSHHHLLIKNNIPFSLTPLQNGDLLPHPRSPSRLNASSDSNPSLPESTSLARIRDSTDLSRFLATIRPFPEARSKLSSSAEVCSPKTNTKPVISCVFVDFSSKVYVLGRLCWF